MSCVPCKIAINSETQDGLTTLGSALQSFDRLIQTTRFERLEANNPVDASGFVDAAIAIDREIQAFVDNAVTRYRKLTLEMAKRMP